MKTNVKNIGGMLSRSRLFILELSRSILVRISFLKKKNPGFHFSLLFPLLFFAFHICLFSQTPKSEYSVAIDREYEPYEFLNDKNKADGFTPALLREIGKSAGISFKFIPMTWPSAINALENKEVDIVNMIYTPERSSRYNFSESHSKITQALFRYVKAEKIKGLSSLSGHTVGFQTNDISHFTLTNRNDFTRRLYDSKLDGLLDLNIGEIDAFFCAEKGGIRFISKYNFTNIKLAESGLFPQKFAFATQKENNRLIELLNTQLTLLQKSGKLKELKDRWFNGQFATSNWFERNQNYLISFGSILGFLLIFLLIWNRTLQRQVLEQTKTLRASEERFRQIAENIDEVFWMTDTEKNKMLYISPSYEKIWGRSSQSLYDQTKHWIETVHPEDRERVLQAAVAMQTKSSYDEIFRIIRPDGNIRWVRDRAFPVQDETGIVYRIAGIAQDITEQKLSEEELVDRKSKIQSLLRISRGLEKAATYSDVNDVIYNEILKTIGFPSVWIYLFDKNLEEATLITSRGTIALILKDSAPILKIKGDPFLEEIASATHTVIVEDAATDPRTNKEIVTMLGNRTIINVPTILVENHIGSVGVGTFGDEGLRTVTPSEEDYLSSIGSHVASALDRIRFIIDLKKIQEELQEKEEKFRGLSEAAFESIFISENGTCIEQNQMAEKMFGYSSDEAIGKSRVEWFIQDDRERVMKYIIEGYKEPYEATALRKDGSTFPCMVCGKTMSYKGKNVRVTSLTDITERKRAEEKIFQQLEELQRWQSVTLEREDRIIELKKEVNELLKHLGKQQKYLST